MNPKLSLPSKPRILVVALRRLGDVLLTTPLIRSIKRAWPDGTIDLLVFAGTEGIVAGNPDIDKTIAMPPRIGPVNSMVLMASLFKRYDLAVSTQAGDRPTLYTLIAGRRHVGLIDAEGPALGRALKAAALNLAARRAIANVHRVEQMLRLADALGIPRVPQVVCPAAAPLPFSPGDRYAVVHAAPMFRYKQWTAAGWRDLAAALKQRGLAVVAIGGPDPAERQYLDEVWQGEIEIHQLSWPENVGLLSWANIFIGPDTSVTHLAAATGCPTVALFGPTDPRLWGPWPAGGLDSPWQASGAIQNRGNVWLVQYPLPCLPCQLEGCERRIDGTSACLEELTAEQVLAAADRALAAG